jgi:hypothetical protein
MAETSKSTTKEKAARAGSGNLNNLDKWKFCLNAA